MLTIFYVCIFIGNFLASFNIYSRKMLRIYVILKFVVLFTFICIADFSSIIFDKTLVYILSCLFGLFTGFTMVGIMKKSPE